jgi:hypothetical protein
MTLGVITNIESKEIQNEDKDDEIVDLKEISKKSKDFELFVQQTTTKLDDSEVVSTIAIAK